MAGRIIDTSVQKLDDTPYEIMEKVIAEGDLSKLTSQERVTYYNHKCRSLGLNPLTRPFEYIKLNGKLTLYARKDCTEQLRHIHKVSIDNLETQLIDGIYLVKVYGSAANGQKDIATGAVSIKGKMGDDLANAMMKAESKAKRRFTLSICGLGLPDETEIDSIKGAEKIVVNKDTGEIESSLPPVPPKPAELPLLDESLVQGLLVSINKSANMDELRESYMKAMDVCKGNRKAVDAIVWAKDLRKDELNSNLQQESNGVVAHGIA